MDTDTIWTISNKTYVVYLEPGTYFYTHGLSNYYVQMLQCSLCRIILQTQMNDFFFKEVGIINKSCNLKLMLSKRFFLAVMYSFLKLHDFKYQTIL